MDAATALIEKYAALKQGQSFAEAVISWNYW
jgi:hypothetical protein